MEKVHIQAGTINYRDEGEGPVILFMHGSLSNGQTWRKVIPLLSKHYRCIVPDLPLGGHSIPLLPSTDFTPPGIAAIMKQFVDALHLDEFILLGNDTGGAYAQVFTMLFPERVTKLILCNVDAFEIFPPKTFALLQLAVKIPGFSFLMAQLFRFKPALRASWALGPLSHKVREGEFRDLYVHNYITNSEVRANFVKVVKGWSPKHTLEAAEKLASFYNPVLVLWGADDQLFPIELGKRVSGIFPNAQFVIVNHSRTLVQEDQPEMFALHLQQFIACSTLAP
ncbi:alpha/beta fold hydrolase [Paenibacillus sp. GCM10027627]|uniref:alpha/beta fold hydrolase n=1 Tax=unclassified Paenibacillus TaxID=185978 RepID=UPI003641BA50